MGLEMMEMAVGMGMGMGMVMEVEVETEMGGLWEVCIMVLW